MEILPLIKQYKLLSTLLNINPLKYRITLHFTQITTFFLIKFVDDED